MKRYYVIDLAGRFLTEKGFTSYYHFEGIDFKDQDAAERAAAMYNASVEVL